jgi:L-seryl-tRNA(Ser) seleniumtransferase
MAADPRRHIPRTDAVLADPRLVDPRRRLGERLVKNAVTDSQTEARRGELAIDEIVDAVLRRLPATASSMQPVLNATGVVLHTNLGRAPLSASAVDALVAAAGYVDVEFDLATGVRARRGRGTIAALLARVPDAADALVVNNGAAALVLAAAALAAGREIVIGRGELIEIGDGFRIPELLESTGARLREVGTTNRTHLADYAEAIGDQTAFVLKIHPSNFSIHGFSASVSVRELATLGVPVVGDIGSGLLEPRPDLPSEPDAATWLREGASLVTASGDKLLGGPQAGLILGVSELVSRLRRHPIQRAMRVDKLTLAALEATLVGPPTPTATALTRDPSALRERATRLADALRGKDVAADVVVSDGLVGGGGAPDLTLPGWGIELSDVYAAVLRRGRPAVIARLERKRCLLDLRCVSEGDDASLLDAVVRAHYELPAEDRSCT